VVKKHLIDVWLIPDFIVNNDDVVIYGSLILWFFTKEVGAEWSYYPGSLTMKVPKSLETSFDNNVLFQSASTCMLENMTTQQYMLRSSSQQYAIGQPMTLSRLVNCSEILWNCQATKQNKRQRTDSTTGSTSSASK
jgi:hypothetical protein